MKKSGRKRQRTEGNKDELISSEGKATGNPKNPFLRLLAGTESTDNVNMRFKLVSETLELQDLESQKIFDETTKVVMDEIIEVVKLPTRDMLDTIILLSNSNITGSINFTNKLNDNLVKDKNNKVITLSSKECSTIRVTLRQIVNTMINEGTNVSMRSVENDDNSDVDVDGDFDKEYTYEHDLNNGTENTTHKQEEYGFSNGFNSEEIDKRLPFDLDIACEWFQQIMKSKNQTISTTENKVIILFEDIDSMKVSLLNDLIKLLSKFSNRLPFKLIFNIGTSLKTFSKKFESEINHLLKIHTFKIEKENVIINRLVKDIILKDDILIGHDSLNLMLYRYENSIKNVEELLKTIKYLKMIFFYNQPLSIVGISIVKYGDFKLTKEYYKCLRMLPSFKNYIENLIAQNTKPSDIMILLNDDEYLHNLLISAVNEFSNYISSLKDNFKFITEVLIPYSNVLNENYLKIYSKLISKESVVRNQFINSLVVSLKKISFKQLEELLAEIYEFANTFLSFRSLASSLKNKLNFDDLRLFKPEEIDKITYKIELRKQMDILTSTLFTYLQASFKTPTEFLFNELFTANSVDLLKTTLFPKSRETLLDTLSDPEKYFNDIIGDEIDDEDGEGMLQELNSKINPIICELFHISRETTLNLNIYDFYQVFKYSLKQDEIMKILNRILDSKDDIFEKYLNDEAKFKFIYQFFNDTTITEDSKWDKLTLVLFLQKCGELINLGLLKQIKRKGDSLEKCIWKGL